MTILVTVTAIVGAAAYAVALAFGRPFAACFALLAATAVPAIAFH